MVQIGGSILSEFHAINNSTPASFIRILSCLIVSLWSEWANKFVGMCARETFVRIAMLVSESVKARREGVTCGCFFFFCSLICLFTHLSVHCWFLSLPLRSLCGMRTAMLKTVSRHASKHPSLSLPPLSLTQMRAYILIILLSDLNANTRWLYRFRPYSNRLLYYHQYRYTRSNAHVCFWFYECIHSHSCKYVTNMDAHRDKYGW